MVSISHWGMFEFYPMVFWVPEGFELADYNLAEWRKPGGVIRVTRRK